MRCWIASVSRQRRKRTIRVFTIGYDSGAQQDVLKKIADTTQAKFYEGKPENIREVFRDISTFF